MTTVYDIFGSRKNQFFGSDMLNYAYDLDTLKNKGECYFAHNVLRYGDYDNSCHIERSNVRLFLETYANHPDVLHWTGLYGANVVLIDALCEDMEIINILEKLDTYPAIDDMDCSIIEHEIHMESWDIYIKNDFKDAIMKKYDLLDINISDEEFYVFYVDMLEKTNTYFEVEAGGNGYIDIDRLVRYLPENCPEILQPEYYS